MALLDDPVPALLPRSAPERVARARAVVRFLQLLVDDAGAGDGGRIGLGYESARTELERAEQGELGAALLALLQRAAAALATSDCWLDWEPAEVDARAAWRVLDDLAGEHPWLPGPEDAQAQPKDYAERLLRAFERAGGDAALVRLWQARLAHAQGDLASAEPLYRALARAAVARDVQSAPAKERARGLPDPRTSATADGGAQAVPAEVRAASLRDLVALLLQRGAVREARGLLDRPADWTADLALRRLAAWAQASAGEWASARALAAGLPPAPAPASAYELRERHGEVFAALPARAPWPRPDAQVSPPSVDRAAYGACALFVYARQPGGARVVRADAAPALRAHAAAHAAARIDAASLPESREARVLATLEPGYEHAGPDGRLAEALSPAARAVALAPLLDDDGEPAGWLELEFEHLLAPSRAALRALAAEAAKLLRPSAGARLAPRASFEGHARVRDEFERAVDVLGAKLQQRVWRGYLLLGDAPVEVARGGSLDALPLERQGGAKALARALSLRSSVGWDAHDARLACCADARSGLVLPFELEGRAVGALVYESARSGDFARFRVDGALRLLAERAPALRLAAFRDAHAAEHGWAPAWDAERQDFLTYARRLAVAARTRAALCLTGERGSGKSLVARWLHHESGRGPLVVQGCAAPVRDWSRPERAARGGSLLVDGVELLDAAGQDGLLQALEAADEGAVRDRGADAADRQGARWILCCTGDLGALASAGALRADLAARLARYELLVPPLRRRRSDIPPLAAAMAERFATAEGLPVPRFDEAAMALLWRQDYPRNLRDLEALVCKLVLHVRRDEIGEAEVRTCAAEFGLVLAARLPSRHPAREDVADALWTTRIGAGRASGGSRSNKTRAAAWLGWDPDTLMLRMRAFGLSEVVAGQRVWEAVEPPDEETSGRAAE